MRISIFLWVFLASGLIAGQLELIVHDHESGRVIAGLALVMDFSQGGTPASALSDGEGRLHFAWTSTMTPDGLRIADVEKLQPHPRAVTKT